jgi:hypothetical protein
MEVFNFQEMDASAKLMLVARNSDFGNFNCEHPLNQLVQYRAVVNGEITSTIWPYDRECNQETGEMYDDLVEKIGLGNKPKISKPIKIKI